MTRTGDAQHPAAKPNGKRRTSGARLNAGHGPEHAKRRLNELRRAADSVGGSSPAVWSSVAAARRVGLQQARTVVESLAVTGLAAAVLSSVGAFIAANRLFRAFVPGTVRELHGRPRLTDPSADCLLDHALAELPGMRGGAVHSLPVRAGRGKPPTMIHLFRVPADAEELFAATCGIMAVTAAQPRTPPAPEILRGLFGLSPAEARVAQGIAARLTVEEIADQSGVSRETVRSQLKIVLAKTGTKRQLDLAVMLLGLPLPKL